MPGQAASAPIVATRTLTDHAGEFPTCSQYAIVGKHAESGPLGFVQHVALLRGSGPVSAPEDVNVFHMGPPLVAGDQAQSTKPGDRKCRADLIADLVLDSEERAAIGDWLIEVETEDFDHPRNIAEQYTVIPHVDWIVAPETGRRIRRRFSCSGFVIEAYRRAGIDLIDTDGQLPDVHEQVLNAVYPALTRLQSVRERIGLPGKGPWKVILPGYLFHSTARATAESPRPPAYSPQSADEGSFPLPPVANAPGSVTPGSRQ